MIEVTGR